MLSLAPYMTDTNAPSEVMGAVQEHLRIARELEAAHPNLAEQSEISSWMLDDSMYMYFDHITATPVSGATSTAWARETEAAVLLVVPSSTPSPHPGLTTTMLPSRTSEPLPSIPTTPAAPQSADNTGSALPTGVLLVVEIIVFSIVGFIVYRRLLRKPG
jgi:hypothetical protein